MVKNIHFWDGSKEDLYDGSFSTSDAITSDLRTQKNTLSVWRIDNPEDVDGIVAALALGRDSIQKMAYLILNEEEIKKMGIPLNKELGQAEGMMDTSILKCHINISELDYWRIGFLAEYLKKLAVSENGHGSKTKVEVNNILKKMIQNNKIDINLMNEKLKTNF